MVPLPTRARLHARLSLSPDRSTGASRAQWPRHAAPLAHFQIGGVNHDRDIPSSRDDQRPGSATKREAGGRVGVQTADSTIATMVGAADLSGEPVQIAREA